MNRFSFISGVVAALLLATVGAALHGAIQPFSGNSFALRIAILGCMSGYLAFLLLQLRPRFGMTLIIASWLVLAFVLMVFNPHVLLWMLLPVGELWLIRCALRYQHILHCTVDALINGLAVCAGLSVMLYTHSLWLALWSYFLTLAFCAVIPARRASTAQQDHTSPVFHQARASAENALRRLQKQTTQSE